MNRALIVGVDVYEERPLQACVNDALDIANYLSCQHWRNRPHSMVVLLDGEASRERIICELSKVVRATESRDTLCFYFSGHGTGFATEACGESELDEAICPIDFNGKRESAIVDDQLGEILNSLRDEVAATCVIDACFSGGMDRLAKMSLTRFRPHLIPMSGERHLLRRVRTRIGQSSAGKVAFVSACGEEEIAQVLDVRGRPSSAFTYSFLHHLCLSEQRRGPNLDRPALSTLVDRVGCDLRDFEMTPAASGPEILRQRPFLDLG